MDKKHYVTLRGVKVEVTDLISSPPDRTSPIEEPESETGMVYTPFNFPALKDILTPTKEKNNDAKNNK